MIKLSSIQWKMECKAWSNVKAVLILWKMECKLGLMLNLLLYSGRWNVKLGLMLKLSSIQWKMECKKLGMECKAWANVKAIFYIVEDGM